MIGLSEVLPRTRTFARGSETGSQWSLV